MLKGFTYRFNIVANEELSFQNIKDIFSDVVGKKCKTVNDMFGVVLADGVIYVSLISENVKYIKEDLQVSRHSVLDQDRTLLYTAQTEDEFLVEKMDKGVNVTLFVTVKN